MATINQKIEQFFDAYAARMNQSLGDNPVIDAEGQAAAFAEYFVESSPVGVMGGANDEQFCAQIPKGYAFYKSIGTKSMTITQLDITTLDEYHVMAKVHWDSRYAKQDGSEEQIAFEVIYLLNTAGDDPKIFAFITGDEQKTLQERGLVPSDPT